MSFGEKLKELRLSRAMTQEELAERLGVRKQTVSRYENSDREPSLRTAERIAACFGIALTELSGDAQDKDAHLRRSIDGVYDALNDKGRALLLSYGEYLLSNEDYAALTDISRGTIRHYLSAAAAGYAAPIEGEDFELIERGAEVPALADFCIDIAGDSMEPYIRDGERVYVRRGDDLKEFDVGIFFVDGDVYCKQWCRDYTGALHLLSANPARQDANILIPPESGRSCVCFGRVLLPTRLPRPSYFN